ncbi:MAG: 50S ribosomal protein L19 [bacterium]|nr:50S ribosomal protein L19 [bacterium]
MIKVRKPQHPDGTFTVRGAVARSTIEKIYPLSFDKFDKVLLLDEYKVRRSKLYYIREKVGKSAKMKSLLGQNKNVVDLFALAVAEAEKKAGIEAAVEEVKTEAAVEEVKTETPVEEVKGKESDTSEDKKE